MKKVHKSSGTDDKKLQTSLKKLNVQPIQAIEEVNMFKEDGNVIHFAAPKGASSKPHAALTVAVGELIRHLLQSTPPFPQTLSPSTATARTRNSPNSFLVSSTSWARTRLHLYVSSLRATRACRRRKAKMVTRRSMMTMTISQIWLRERTSRAKLSKE